ncbi:MAG: type VI secretion lipoprotein TssJ [Deltaproteobacteria bacterium]|jgi:predicted component of type VI protein secretion system|nr:type VI secretion lipoprotein TssJ [Deltaproteobacteria bacterium]
MATHMATLLAALMAVLMLTACGPKVPSPVPPPGAPAKSPGALEYAYSPGGIGIGIMSDPDLNITEDVPTALSICIYQLSDTSWFQGNISTSQGLTELLACPPKPAALVPGGPAPTPPAGVVSAERRLIQPGQSMDLSLDRMVGTKFVGVVGGYSALTAPGSASVLAIPYIMNNKLFRANTYELVEMRAWLILKRQSLAFFLKDKATYDKKTADFLPPSKPEPPAYCPVCAEQAAAAAAQEGAVPAPPVVVPAQQGVVPAQQGAVPAQQGAVPAQQGAVPAQQGVVPGQQGAVPAQQGVVPAQQGTLPPPPLGGAARTSGAATNPVGVTPTRSSQPR